MGGYKRKKVYLLEWEEDHELCGLEVRMGTIPLRDYLDITNIARGNVPSRFENADEVNEWVFRTFADALISWNLEDDEGQHVPETYESIMDQDREFVMTLIQDWTQALQVVSRPLPKPSPAGERSAEESIPMETL